MRMSEFDKLVDELAACARKRGMMAKALPEMAVVAMPLKRLHAPTFASLVRDMETMAKASSGGRPFQRPDEFRFRVQQQRERLAKARSMLKSMVAAGQLNAVTTAKIEMRLNRYAAGLPL